MAMTIGKCPACNGTGYESGHRCGLCEGRGIIGFEASEILEWQVPKIPVKKEVA